jgi:hypothetical protein
VADDPSTGASRRIVEQCEHLRTVLICRFKSIAAIVQPSHRHPAQQANND